MIVYLVWHTHPQLGTEDDEKLIGIYSSEEQAQSAVMRAKILPGFSDHPENFEISTYKVDKDHWTEGFVTARYKET